MNLASSTSADLVGHERGTVSSTSYRNLVGQERGALRQLPLPCRTRWSRAISSSKLEHEVERRISTMPFDSASDGTRLIGERAPCANLVHALIMLSSPHKQESGADFFGQVEWRGLASRWTSSRRPCALRGAGCERPGRGHVARATTIAFSRATLAMTLSVKLRQEYRDLVGEDRRCFVKYCDLVW